MARTVKTTLPLISAVFAIAICMVSAQAAEKVRIGLAAAQASDYVAFGAAQELGYFKDAGLEAEMTVYRGGAAALEAMSAGAADLVTISSGGLALVVAKGEKAKIVATIASKAFGWQLVVKADSKFKTTADLADAKVGITARGTATDMLANAVARKAGIKIQMVPVGGAGLVPSLLSGRVDAVVLFPPATFQLIESKQARSLVDLGREVEEVVPDAIVAPEAFSSKRPDVLRATLAAIYKAMRHIQDQKEWGLDFTKRYTKETDDKINAITYNDVVRPLSRSGTTDAAWIRQSLKLSSDAWDNKDVAVMNPEVLFTNDYLPKN